MPVESPLVASSGTGPSPITSTAPPSPSPSTTLHHSNSGADAPTHHARAAAATASIAVFLFAKEKLLFRYPDTDPFVVDVAVPGSSNDNAGSNSSGSPAGGRTENSRASSSSSRDRQRRNNSSSSNPDPTKRTDERGGGGGEGESALHPDSLSAAAAAAASGTTPTSAAGGSGGVSGGGRLKKKSPHVHVTVAVDPKDKRGDSTHVTMQSSDASMSSSGAGGGGGGGVAPQRGMRRPMSAYTIVNDNLGVSLTGLGQAAGSSHTHRTRSPTTASASASGHPALKGSAGGGAATATTTHVQNTSTGSTRRRTSAASSGTPAAMAAAAATSAMRGAKSSPSANTGASGQQSQQQQQQQHQVVTGAATCVGIATNVLMHLLRGALNGCTTINMVNCTFLVFPLTLAMSAQASSSGAAAAASSGVTAGGFAASLSDRQRSPSRAATTALLVVAMKEPDTDSGSIANFAQCFVNILCREEQRCRYVSTELDRMEALTSHWEVGGAGAVAAAAAAAADTRAHHGGSSASSFSGLSDIRGTQLSHRGAPAAAATAASLASPTRNLESREDSACIAEDNGRGGGRSRCDYDYLFAPPRPARRGGGRLPDTHNTTGNHASTSSNNNANGAHRGHEGDYHGNLDEGGPRSGAAGLPMSPASARSASPFGLRRRASAQSPLTSTSTTPTTAVGLPSSSLYQHLAAYVRLASEVQQVAQCIDLWNRTSRVRERGGGGSGSVKEGMARRVSRFVTRNPLSSDASGGVERVRPSVVTVPRDPLRRYSNVGSGLLPQQSWVTASPGAALDDLPDAILVNEMLLLPMAHLTGQERLEQTQTMRSAYSRIHPCSVVTVEEQQFTEELQRSYADMMGRRYAKLIPLATVYALLVALPSPRRAGSLYRTIELTLLEAVQRRHARAAAAAANTSATASSMNSHSVASPLAVGVNFASLVGGASSNSPSAHQANASTNNASFRPAREVEDETPASSAVAAAAATTAAGLDFLAMEIIDFLRVHGAISVASEQWVCFTHGEVTPADYLAAAVERRRRHRMRDEKRRQRAAAVSGSVEGGASSSAYQERRKERHVRSAKQEGAGVNEAEGRRSGGTVLHASSWASSDATTVAAGDVASHRKATPTQAAAENPMEAVRDIDTVPAALVLHMLEKVVDTQQPQQQQRQSLHVPASASAGSFSAIGIGGGRYHSGENEATSSNTVVAGGVPQSPSTGNTFATAAGATATAVSGTVLTRTPRSSETDTSAGRASYRAGQYLDASPVGAVRMSNSPQQQSTSLASSPPLTYHTRIPGRVVAGGGGGAPTVPGARVNSSNSGAPQPPAAPLSVYCAWGSACPLCEQLAAHPRCWTTAAHRGYSMGFYVPNASSASHVRRSHPAIQLEFPSLDASVYTCAIHARRVRDTADLSSLMQSSYSSISGAGSSAVSPRGGVGSSSLLHSLQPWFIRPHMFVTPVTAAYGVSPFEIYERMSHHSNRGPVRQQMSSLSGCSAAGVPIMVPVRNTSSLVEPERRELLMITRTQSYAQEAAAAAAAAAVTPSAASRAVSGEEQGHTLLQCADIPAGAVDYLHRCCDVIRRRLAYSRAEQRLLAQYEQALDRQQQQSVPVGGVPGGGGSAAPAAAAGTGAFGSSGGGGNAAPLERYSQASTSTSVEDAALEATTSTIAVNQSVLVPASVASASSPAAATPAAAAAITKMDGARSAGLAISDAASTTAAGATQAVPVRGAEVRCASPPVSAAASLSKLSSSADVRPRSFRYGRRQLPLHIATSPLTNVTLLFDSATPTAAVRTPAAAAAAEDRPPPNHQHHEANDISDSSSSNVHAGAPLQQKARPSNSPTRTATQAGTTPAATGGVVGGIPSNTNTNGFSFTVGVGNLMDGERTLPAEVLMQYVLHHLIALSWGKRGVEVDTLVRLIERNLRRLPPLLANLQYVHHLRNAGFTSESAAASLVAMRAPAASGASEGTGNNNNNAAAPSAVFTAVHTRLAASPFSLSTTMSPASVGPGKPSPSNLTDTPEDGSETSPYSGGSRAATALPVTESEVQLLQAYEVLERLNLMTVLTPYATWPVRTVPTRLLLHAVVNEFCDVLYVDSSERDEEVDHWDLPVAAQ